MNHDKAGRVFSRPRTPLVVADPDLATAAGRGHTAAIERLTTDDVSQHDLAMLATYVLEKCTWKVQEASSDEVEGEFSCPAGGLLTSRTLLFELNGAKISSIEQLTSE
jgi:hypothetical protein